MMTLSIPDELAKRLEIFAAQAPLSKEEYLVQALEEFLDDQEDYLIAHAQSTRFEKGLEEPRPFSELVEEYEREYGDPSLDS